MIQVQTGNMLDVIVEGKSIGLKQRDSDHRKYEVIWLPKPEGLRDVLATEIKRLNPQSETVSEDKDKAPERIRLVVRSGLFDGHWYFPDAAIMPFESEFHYVPESALATVRRDAFKAAAGIATMMAAGETFETGRQKALSIAAALERAAESGEGEDDDREES